VSKILFGAIVDLSLSWLSVFLSLYVAIQFLNHRNTTYLTTPENKQHEASVINHIQQANQYHTPDTSRIQDTHHHNQKPSKNKKWAKINYVGREVRSITNLFKHTDIGIAFNTVKNIDKLLSPTHHNTQPKEYTKSGVYALKCNQCKKWYIGQTGRSFYTHSKEHMQYYRQNYKKSQFAKHLLEENHPLDSIEKTMSILQSTKKGKMLNTAENSTYTRRQTQATNSMTSQQ
jgi:hypothetical protein